MLRSLAPGAVAELRLVRSHDRDMSNPLSGMKIEHWWHAFTILGGAGMGWGVRISRRRSASA